MTVNTDDLAYYRGRVAQERTRAAASRHPEVRHAHQQLAALYEQRLAVS